MNIILLVVIIALLFAALSLLERRDRARTGYRAPAGADLRQDRDAVRLRTELDANVDHTDRHAA